MSIQDYPQADNGMKPKVRQDSKGQKLEVRAQLDLISNQTMKSYYKINIRICKYVLKILSQGLPDNQAVFASPVHRLTLGLLPHLKHWWIFMFYQSLFLFSVFVIVLKPSSTSIIYIIYIKGVASLVVARGHYSIDVVLAYFVTTRLWWEESAQFLCFTCAFCKDTASYQQVFF